MEIRQMLVSSSKYYCKCPNIINPTRIVVHNTYNDASANNEVSYMINNTNEVSYHIAVDDKEAVQGIPFNRNTWNAGDGLGKGNMEGISIEICYSKSGGDRFIKAEQNAAKLIAQLLKERGWGIDRVTKHQDYSNKYCPHRTLDMGWQRFLNMVQAEMNGTSISVLTPKSENNQVNVYYKAKTIKHGWLPEVKNLEDYAGYENSPFVDLMIRVDKGSVKYRAHTTNGKQFSWVNGYNEHDYKNGYAGNDRDILDTVEVEYFTPDNIRPFKYAKYKVNNYDWQIDLYKKNGMDGYAGAKGVPMTKFQIVIE